MSAQHNIQDHAAAQKSSSGGLSDDPSSHTRQSQPQLKAERHTARTEEDQAEAPELNLDTVS